MRSSVLLLLILLAVLPAHAEDEPAPPGQAAAAEVAGWLKELRSDDYQVREAARRQLLARGLEARELLEAAQDDPDPEVRRTVRAVLERAPAQPTQPVDRVKSGDFGGIGRLTVQVKDRPLAEVIERLDRALGAHIEPPEAWMSKPVTLDLVDTPCYDILAAIEALTATRAQQPFDAAGRMLLVAHDGKVQAAPRAASGPMQLTVVEVAATRSFGVEAPPRYALKLRLEWAPFVQVQQYERPSIEVARDPDGKRFQASAAMQASASYGIGTTMKHHTTTVYLEPADTGCQERLGALELRVPMRLRYDVATVAFDDLGTLPACLGPDGKAAKPGSNESVQLHSVERADGGAGQWVVDFTATLLEEGAQQTLEAFLVEADGTQQRVSVYGGRSIAADGTLRITARAYRGSTSKPRGVRVTWFRREEEGALRFRLEGVPLR